MDQDLIRQVLAAYTDESAELLDELLVRVDAFARLRGEALQASAREAMRIAHNLKGSAVSVGLEAAGAEAHALEDVIEPLSRGVEADVEEVARRARTALAQLQDSIRTGLRDQQESLATFIGEVATPRSPPGHPAESATQAGDEEITDADSAELSTARSESLRVDTRRLDELLDHTADLLAMQGRLAERNRQLEELHDQLSSALPGTGGEPGAQVAGLLAALGALARADRQELLAFGRLNSGIAGATRQLRLVPVRGLAPAWRRTALDAARKSGKEVQVDIDVGGLELDKQVLDQLRDPVIHLLRNAVDHGIEAPAVRAAVGKPATGRIRVHAELVDGRARLEISDDGGGLQTDRIAELAVRRGLLTSAQLGQLRREQVHDLIFATGFSTAPEVSELSGRGVGLDVVRRAVEELGGRVEAIASGPLGGASFVLTLPMNVLSTRALLVSEGASRFALPNDLVERTLRLEQSALQSVDGIPALKLDHGEPLRVAWLSVAMGLPPSDTERLKVVVIARGARRLGLIVGDVLWEEELIVKRLPWNLRRAEGVAGAAILADGALALVVDLARLLDPASDGARAHAAPARAARVGRILLADDSPTAQTLERTALLGAGYEVDVVADGEAAWAALQAGRHELLVSDIQMPKLDGVALTERIRADAALGQLPVVLVTSLSRPEHVERGLAAGANEYVVKGQLDVEGLLAAVARHLPGRQDRRNPGGR